jgi:hypothetical protein
MLAACGLVTVWLGSLTEKDWNMDDEEGEVDEIALARENALLSRHAGSTFCGLDTACACMVCRRHGAVVAANKVALVVLGLRLR